ncbi:hypothetical protein CRYUN_Cryun28dG0089600 [Craigia yunnanensis]
MADKYDKLDIHVGKDKLVEESDIKKLIYLQAIVKETLRLYPAGPLSVHHESMEDCVGQNFELIPFGSGRRMCPGVSFALQVLELTLASLLQGFELGTPSDEPVDMSEAIGMTNLKATPLQVFVSPRPPALCYQLLIDF